MFLRPSRETAHPMMSFSQRSSVVCTVWRNLSIDLSRSVISPRAYPCRKKPRLQSFGRYKHTHTTVWSLSITSDGRHLCLLCFTVHWHCLYPSRSTFAIVLLHVEHVFPPSLSLSPFHTYAQCCYSTHLHSRRPTHTCLWKRTMRSEPHVSKHRMNS